MIQEESDTWVRENGPVNPGSAAITTGGMLQASHVIHAVGPYYEGEESDPVLASAVTAAIDRAVEQGLESMAFPLIASGLRNYPPERAAQVIANAVADWLSEHPDELTEVRLVGFSDQDAELFAAALK